MIEGLAFGLSLMMHQRHTKRASGEMSARHSGTRDPDEASAPSEPRHRSGYYIP